MKKISASAMFCLIGFMVSAQFIYKIKADSVLITNDSCNAELILENSTKNVCGFLFNKGNGRTEFRSALIKLNDSVYVVGCDTLRLHGSAGSGSITANNGLTANTSTNVQLGGTLIQPTTIDVADQSLTISGNTFNNALTVTNSGEEGGGIYSQSAHWVGVMGVANNQAGVYGESETGQGLFGVSHSGTAMFLQSAFASNNTAEPIAVLQRLAFTPSNGIGGSIDFSIITTTDSVSGGMPQIANRLISKWTNVQNSTRTSQFEIVGVNSGVTARKLALAGSGLMTLDGYAGGAFQITDTSTNKPLTVDASGNIKQGKWFGGSSGTNGFFSPNQISSGNTSHNANYHTFGVNHLNEYLLQSGTGNKFTQFFIDSTSAKLETFDYDLNKYIGIGMDKVSGGNGAVTIFAQNGANASNAYIFPDSIKFWPNNGIMNINTLQTTNDTAAFKPTVWNPTTGSLRKLNYWPSGSGNSSSGTLIGIRVLTSGTSYTPTSGTASISAQLIGGGGGGGGVTGANNNVGAGGGGGSASYVIKYVTGVGSGPYTYAIGAGGTAGASTGGTGGNGGNTTLTIGATTYTSPGGSGGIGQTAGTAAAIVLGGNGGTAGTNGDVNGAGTPGGTGLRLSGTVGSSGAGASSVLGGGGNALNTAGAGNAATGFGSGGSGGLSTANTARTGGAGSSGVIIIYEYR